MKVVLLAGGLGSRISEESHIKPKPMIELGDKPILWHIMRHFAHHGFDDFIICCGYKQYVIKEYFAHYDLHNSDLTFDFAHPDRPIVHHSDSEPWRVTLVDTGLHTMTGGRLLRVRRYLDDEPFFLTYGDGVSDVDLRALAQYHRAHGRIATVTAVTPPARFGVLRLTPDNLVDRFEEKPQHAQDRINGGFFALNPAIFSYLREGDATVFERHPLEELARDRELMAFPHDGFWHPMDTMRDKAALDAMWESGEAPWKTWEG